MKPIYIIYTDMIKVNYKKLPRALLTFFSGQPSYKTIAENINMIYFYITQKRK